MDVEGLGLLHPTSCLSPGVRHIVCELDTQVPGVAGTECLTADGCINWEKMEEILPAANEESEEYFLRATQQLLPVSRRVKIELENALAEKRDLFLTNLEWTSAPEMVRRSVRLLEEDTEAGVVLSLLLSTAMLERSLGDVFLLRGFPCPSMLKDLLTTSELQNIFGTTVIQLLQVVIGRPKSLNLRNISWHGFVSPGEVPTHYVWLLLCVTASLGAILAKQGICLKDIPHRASITFPQTEVLQDVFPDLSADDLPKLRLLFKESVFMPATTQPLWTLALDTFAENRYGECLVLLLPLLEHGMRSLYCLANHCHNRLLTAENTVLFTTFDEILSATMMDGQEENKLRDYIGDGHIMMLLDLLTYPEGPRLRDVISHGEVHLETCPRVLVRHLLGVFSALCHLALPHHSTLPQESILEQTVQAVCSYQSRFHPISLLKKQIVETADSLSKWNTLQRPPEHKFETKITWQNPPGSATVCDAAQWLLEMSSFNSKHFAFISLVQPFDDIKTEVVRMLAAPICTLYRGWSKQNNEEYISSAAKSREEEVIKLLRRVMSECTDISDQVQFVLRARYTQWQNKELRSRQRKTYMRMLDSVPLISSRLRLVTLLVIVQLYSLDEFNASSVDKQAKRVKMLKNVLQQCENVRSSTTATKNRWDEACTSMDELAHIVHTQLSAV